MWHDCHLSDHRLAFVDDGKHLLHDLRASCKRCERRRLRANWDVVRLLDGHHGAHKRSVSDAVPDAHARECRPFAERATEYHVVKRRRSIVEGSLRKFCVRFIQHDYTVGGADSKKVLFAQTIASGIVGGGQVYDAAAELPDFGNDGSCVDVERGIARNCEQD